MITDVEKKKFLSESYFTRKLSMDMTEIDRAVDLAWEHMQEMNPWLVRDDPSTWVGDITDSCRVAGNAKRRGRIKLRECVQKEPFLQEMVYGNSEITSIIHALLGPKGSPRTSHRGLYPIVPSLTSSNHLQGGMDAHPFQVSCIIYLSDVTEDGGAFILWKGSHRIMQDTFPGKASWEMSKPKAEELRLIAEDKCERVFIPGEIGTAVFWHHRTLHTPGTNRTQNVRHALIADFLQSDWESKQDLPHEDDIWADWAISE